MTTKPSGLLRRARRRQARVIALLALAASAGLAPLPALANNYLESLGWQFKTSADRANQAVVLDVIAKRRGGYYAAPTYTTSIARQFNCSIAATATGNNDAQTALANSPTVNGATSTATGNANATQVGDGPAGAVVDGEQANSGAVSSGVTSETSAQVRGAAWQALNATQTNTGDQSAGIQGSAACAFGALN